MQLRTLTRVILDQILPCRARDRSRQLSQRGISELSHANRRLKEAERRCQELEFLLKSEAL